MLGILRQDEDDEIGEDIKALVEERQEARKARTRADGQELTRNAA